MVQQSVKIVNPLKTAGSLSEEFFYQQVLLHFQIFLCVNVKL
jgi:hypothetical protein